MKRAAILFAIAAIGSGLPGLAEAQGRARVGEVQQQRREQQRDIRDSLGADWRPQQDEARRGVRQGRLLPLESVAPRLNRRAPGRLLDAGLENRGAQTVYRVRWQAADGRRIDYLIDAATGAVIGAQGE